MTVRHPIPAAGGGIGQGFQAGGFLANVAAPGARTQLRGFYGIASYICVNVIVKVGVVIAVPINRQTDNGSSC